MNPAAKFRKMDIMLEVNKEIWDREGGLNKIVLSVSTTSSVFQCSREKEVPRCGD